MKGKSVSGKGQQGREKRMGQEWSTLVAAVVTVMAAAVGARPKGSHPKQ